MALSPRDYCVGSLYTVHRSAETLVKGLQGPKVQSLFFNQLKTIQRELRTVQREYGSFSAGFQAQVDGLRGIVSKYIDERGEIKERPTLAAAQLASTTIFDNANELIRQLGDSSRAA